MICYINLQLKNNEMLPVTGNSILYQDINMGQPYFNIRLCNCAANTRLLQYAVPYGDTQLSIISTYILTVSNFNSTFLHWLVMH